MGRLPKLNLRKDLDSALFIMMGLIGIASIGALIPESEGDSTEAIYDDPYGGHDLTEGSDGDEAVTGTDADEAIQSYEGDDPVDAGAGDDLVWTGYGDDTVAGDDEIYLGYGDDLYGAENTGPDEGTDTIDGGDDEDDVTLSSVAQGRDPDHL